MKLFKSTKSTSLISSPTNFPSGLAVKTEKATYWIKDGKKYNQDGSIRTQETDALTNVKAQSASIFKDIRDRVAVDPEYVRMRKEWRAAE